MYARAVSVFRDKIFKWLWWGSTKGYKLALKTIIEMPAEIKIKAPENNNNVHKQIQRVA